MKSELIVMKFGGSSVANKDKIFSVSEKIKKEVLKKNKVVVVVSAQGDTTDYLLDLSREINKNPNLRELDVLLSSGEQISMALLSMALESIGIKSISLTGWQAGIQTCNCHGNSKIINIFTQRIVEELKKNDVVVIAGFQGINKNEDITTMGRGGSDTSAVALAAALKTKNCKIYTDVDGVYTADPRVVSDASRISNISYDDMIKLADNGAQVLNKRSVRLAKKYGIEISVLSSMLEESKGTNVNEVDFKANPITSIAMDEGLFVLKILSDDLDYVINEIKNNNIVISDMFSLGNFCIFLVNMEQIEVVQKLLNCEFNIDPNVSKISIISTNQDSIFDNFCEIKSTLGKKIKYSYICGCISIIVDESVGRETLNSIHEKYNFD